MRSFSVLRGQLLIAAAAVLLLCHITPSTGEEISFYGDDGSIFTITLSGGCYDFKSGWNKKAIAGEIDRGCFHVWDGPGCRGEKRELTRGSEGLRDFKKIDFHKRISSVSLCEQGPTHEHEYHPRPSYPSENSHSGGQKETPTLDNSKMQQIREVAVSEHNKFRVRHNSPPLKGDPAMHEEAQRYAEYLAANNKFELNRNSRHLGNIASSFRRDPEDAIKDAVGRWYDGVNYYDFNNPGFSSQAGSFTAVVWKASTHMGIGAAWNKFQNNWVIISYYSPSPNLQGAFRENVLPFTH